MLYVATYYNPREQTVVLTLVETSGDPDGTEARSLASTHCARHHVGYAVMDVRMIEPHENTVTPLAILPYCMGEYTGGADQL
jgi:hypothetical protein